MARPQITIDPIPIYPDIIIAQDLLSTDPPRFHWHIFVQSPTSQQGTKFHAVERPLDFFTYQMDDYTMIYSRSVTAAAIIGSLGTHSVDELNNILNAIPCNVMPEADVGIEPRFSCRVWTREAVRRLHNAGFINCPDVDALEAEMMRYGTEAVVALENGAFSKAILRRAMASNST